jgi:hypothetical protein
VPNLVEIVKGYAAHEGRRWRASSKPATPPSPPKVPQLRCSAEVQLRGALRQIFALAEAYPDLKANQNLQQLRSELADLENKIERRGASSTTRPNTMPRAQQAYLPCCSPNLWACHRRTSSTSTRPNARATVAPPVKF